MPQLNEALVDTIIGTIFFQYLCEDMMTLVDLNDDALIVYNNLVQLQ
uniref:ATP synthase F0 subunit 8 n=1 Tax=Paracercomonas marina TaxID=372086 RepID=A0A0B5GSC9_9EUKA|nr:ATP synthase F0 subunit 8 [Paracercomonas marina]AJF22850.1 ATP synthase F0 subunit 8 [Paracercomonas marina]